MARREINIARSKAKKYLGKYDCGTIWGASSGTDSVCIFGTTLEVLEKHAPSDIDGVQVSKEVRERE